jgi:hypothetical protein
MARSNPGTPVSLDSPTRRRPRPMVPTSGRGICYRQLRIGRSLLLVPAVPALWANQAEASAPTPGTPPSERATAATSTMFCRSGSRKRLSCRMDTIGLGSGEWLPVRPVPKRRRAQGTPPNAERFERTTLIDEARRIERRASVWGAVYLSGARWWRRFNTFLVALAAVLAALSGAAGLSEAVNHKVLAVLALLAAAISAVSAALGAAGRASTALNAATADTMLADSARRFYLTIAPHMAIEEVRAQFDRLCEQRNRVVAASPGDVMPWTHRRYAFFKGHIERSMGRARSEYEAASKDASSDADSAASTSID